MTIHRIFTDNSKKLIDSFLRLREYAATGRHEFEGFCVEFNREQGLSPRIYLQTNGNVERFHKHIEDILQRSYFYFDEELEMKRHCYIWLYNQESPQSLLMTYCFFRR